MKKYSEPLTITQEIDRYSKSHGLLLNDSDSDRDDSDRDDI